MRRISPPMVQTWVTDAAGGLSARSVVKYHALLHKIFSRAVIDRVVPVNPCTHTALPCHLAAETDHHRRAVQQDSRQHPGPVPDNGAACDRDRFALG
jgi:hypothetical protein